MRSVPTLVSSVKVFVCAFALFLAAAVFAQNNASVRIMAANLNGNSQTYEPFAIRIFQGLKPDVIAIQEFNYSNNTAADFRAMVDTAFGTNFFYYREPTSNSSDIPNGIISRYPILFATNWVDTQVANRSFAWARIDMPGTNDLYIVSVHFLTSSSTARTTEANNLKALMQANFPANAFLVVAGDFNAGTSNETCVTTWNGYLATVPSPVDKNGNPDTSLNRNSQHDFVLASPTLTNFSTATVFGPFSNPQGLVFDSRVYSAGELANFSPVQSGDSGLAQHMAVMRDFLIPIGTNAGVPVINTQPQSLTVVQGSNATFTVSATGTAPLAYQWRLSSTNLPGAVTNFYSLAAAQPNDAGNYSVVITNSAGSVTSAVAVLTVVAAPIIKTNPVPLSVVQGNSANFSVSAIGLAPLSYQWRFNGTNISGAMTNPFVLANAQLTNAGNYSVVITNSAGSVTSSLAALTVTFAATGSVVTLAGWDMSGASSYGVSPMAPTTNAPVVTVGGLTRGSGVTVSGSAAARTWGGNNFGSASAAAAITANQFATFSITPNAGYNVSFTSLDKYDYKRSTAGPPNGALQFQVGAGAFVTVTNFAISSTTGASLGPVDLSGIAALQNVTNTVTFRLVNWGASNSGGNWYIFDSAVSTAPDLSVQGVINTPSAPVVNPATLAPVSLTNRVFTFSVVGSAGAGYVVQSSTNLTATNWVPVITNGSPFSFSENVSNAPQKFFRAVSQ